MVLFLLIVVVVESWRDWIRKGDTEVSASSWNWIYKCIYIYMYLFCDNQIRSEGGVWLKIQVLFTSLPAFLGLKILDLLFLFFTLFLSSLGILISC